MQNQPGAVKAHASSAVLMQEVSQFVLAQGDQVSGGGMAAQQSQGGGTEEVGEERHLLVLRKDFVQNGPQLVLEASPGLDQQGAMTGQLLEPPQD